MASTVPERSAYCRHVNSVDALAQVHGRFADSSPEWAAHPAKLVEAALRGLAITGDGAFISAVATMLA
jgi:hypothetical protein